ncbi:MAG: hypothetical protein AAB459_03445 [Patescibacteria group bacterium]
MAYKDPNDPRRLISGRKHYLKNKDKYIANAIAAKEKLRAYIRKEKNRPCLDCNAQYPYYVMQFDHIRDKKYHISTLVSSNNLKKLQEELKKCEVVCANCHAERTYQRGVAQLVE